MKKAILFLFVAVMFFCSCKKDQKKGPVTPSKTYKVNFNVSAFTQEIIGSTKNQLQTEGLKSNSTIGIQNYLTELYYVVTEKNDYNQTPVHMLKQDSTASNFGTISDNLPAGDYTIMIAAGKKDLLFSTTHSGDIGPHWDINYQPFRSPWKDTFFDKFDITVSGAINQSVTLNRIVGQLEVNILDAIPANASSFGVTVNDENFTYIVYPSEIFRDLSTLTIKTAIPPALIGTTNYKKDIIINNTGTPFTVTIVCYDASNVPIGTAIVNNVTCEKNRKTILSGKLFGTNNTFNVNLSPWNPTPVTTPF